MIYYEQTIDDKFNAMVDSVNIIDMIIAAGIHNLANYEVLDRNYRHLEYMLLENDIIADGRDLQGFQDAINAGRVFTGLI